MRWFEQEEDGVRYSTLEPPFDWLSIGNHPSEKGMTRATAESFDLFLNVDDVLAYQLDAERPRADTRYIWQPIHEDSYWGYAPFFFVSRTLDRAEEEGLRTYLHCYAAFHRAPSVGLVWLWSRTGSLEAAALEFEKAGFDDQQGAIDCFRREQERGRIPRRIDDFVQRYAQQREEMDGGPVLRWILYEKPFLEPPLREIESNSEEQAL
jgi:hypothetical protein